jgi:hypothetical protein
MARKGFQPKALVRCRFCSHVVNVSNYDIHQKQSCAKRQDKLNRRRELEARTGKPSKVRVYELAKELRLDVKRVIDEARREGVTVRVPSNTLTPEIADRIRNSYGRDYPEYPEDQSLSKNENPDNELIAFGLFSNRIRVVSLTSDGTYTFLDDSLNLHSILYIASSETKALQHAIEELESLINDSKAKEADFQDFFKRNPEFVLNDEYQKAHPHIILTKDSGETFIPDFVLQPISQNPLCDLLELKLPSAQVFVLQQRRMRFSSAVMEACAQLREYAAFFDEERNRRVVYEQYGLMAFKPKMFVIIGRRGTINPIDARRIESDLPQFCLRTYDDIVARMKVKVTLMQKKTATLSVRLLDKKQI